MRSLLRFAALAAVAPLAITGCSNANNNAQTKDGQIPKPSVQCEVPKANIDDSKVDTAKAKGQITFMTQGLQADFREFFEKQIAAFEKDNPGTKIKWTDIPGDAEFDQVISTQAQGCKMADVVNVPSTTILALSKRNLFLDYDVKAPGIGDKFVPSIWNSINLGANEHHTALPWYFGPFVNTYNKKIFKDAGLDPEKSPATMTERFEDAHKIAKAKTGAFAIYGNASWYLNAEWQGMGVKMMNDDSTEFTFAKDKNAKEWVDQMAKLYKEGGISPDSLTGDPDPSKDYNNGSLAFGTPNASFLRSVKDSNPGVYKNTGVSKFPRNKGQKPIYEGQFIGVSVTTKNTPLAVKWAEHITSAEQELAWTRDGGAIIFPAATEALEKIAKEPPANNSDPVFAQAYKIAAEDAQKAEAVMSSFYLTGKVQSTLVDNVNQAIRGEVSSQDALDKAQKQMNKLLKQL
ncbi:MAG: extracellular solute-binding protein [Winkia neuii]|nr:extracellular solute-binding protein [Winkia neuii]MDK8100376.1 extracellular solute-binding protein [Winkia neuii]MDU3135672.1 extracellular solute-binding protein [Winkia neuii]